MRKLLSIVCLALAGVANGQVKTPQEIKDSLRDDRDKFWHDQYIMGRKAQRVKDSISGIYTKADSILYEYAVDAYDNSRKDRNRDEFVKWFIIDYNQDIKNNKEEAKRIAGLKKKYGISTAQKLLDKKVWLGMTDKMIIDEFGYGEVKRSVSKSGMIETWYYLGENSHCIGNDCPILDYSLTFKDHKLVALSDL